MLRLLSLLSLLAVSAASDAAANAADAASFDPSNIEIEMFDIDAYACDLNHEPIADATFGPGDFVRVCVHTIDLDSDIIVQGMRYFVLVAEEAADLRDAAIQFSDHRGKIPSLACSAKDNMCVIETVLDESLFDSSPDNTEIFGYGALVLGRSGPAHEYDQFEDVPIQITLSTTAAAADSNAVSDHEPNLEGEYPAAQKFLRGTSQNA